MIRRRGAGAQGRRGAGAQWLNGSTAKQPDSLIDRMTA